MPDNSPTLFDSIPEPEPNPKVQPVPPAASGFGDDPAFALQKTAKDLLSLAEKDRRAAEIAFKGLGFDKQLETALALQGDELHEWLQLAEDFTELVRELPPEHLHQAIRLIGEEDALNLLQAASSAQMQQLTDIEWFTEGKLDRKKVRHWLELMMTLDEDEVDQAMQGMDINALAQFLRPAVRFAVDKDNLLLALHLNQRYLFTPDDLDARDDFSRRLLDFLYAVDRDLFGDVMALLIDEDAKIVENDMYGGREDRLLKRGFPAQSEAEFLLEIVNVSNYGIVWPKLEGLQNNAALNTTEIQTTSRSQTPFLLTALAWGRSAKILGERTEREFIKESADLANSLLLAHTKDSGKPELRSEALLAVQVLTSVALEALSGIHVAGSRNQLMSAAEKLKALELRELFQIGWSLTREVARDAWALAFDERIDHLTLPRNIKWLPAGLRKDVMDAEDLMSWRRIAATAVETPPSDERRVQELLSWPRLCRLRHAVWLAQNDLTRRASEAGHRPIPEHGNTVIRVDELDNY